MDGGYGFFAIPDDDDYEPVLLESADEAFSVIAATIRDYEHELFTLAMASSTYILLATMHPHYDPALMTIAIYYCYQAWEDSLR